MPAVDRAVGIPLLLLEAWTTYQAEVAGAMDAPHFRGQVQRPCAVTAIFEDRPRGHS